MICIIGALLGPVGGNLQGLEADNKIIFGRRLATYCTGLEATIFACWEPTGFGGYIIDMLGPLLGQQVVQMQEHIPYLDLSPSGCH